MIAKVGLSNTAIYSKIKPLRLSKWDYVGNLPFSERRVHDATETRDIYILTFNHDVPRGRSHRSRWHG